MRGQLEFVRASASREMPVLDVNGGLALHHESLRAQGYTVESRDLADLRKLRSGDHLRSAKDNPDHSVSVPGLGRYGTVVALHVLEHLPDPAFDVAVLRDLVAKGGSLVFLVPNAGCWQALLLADRWNGFDVPRHPLSYTESNLDSLLEATGLKIARRKRVLLRDQATGLATSLGPSMDPALREERSVKEANHVALLKNVIYGVIVAAAIPLVLLEAASGASSILLVEARRSYDAPAID